VASPKARWCHPEDVESDDDKLAFDHIAWLKYCYILGRKFKLCGRNITRLVPIIEAKSTDS
jgi:hypothetical protein